MPPKVLIVAGEESGDAHGAALVRALREIEPSVEVEAWGGRRLAEAGARLRFDLVEHAVMGLRAVIPKIPFFRRVLKSVLARIEEWRPDVVIPIDNPGLNLRIAKRARKVGGVRVLYYVSPQVWAWRRSRIRGIVRAIDKMLVLFPFEEPLYQDRGARVEWVGHPLFDYLESERPDPAFRDAIGVGPDEPLVAVLPGSRASEIKRHLGMALDAAAILRRARPAARFVLAAARPEFVPLAREAARARGLDVAVVDRRAHDAMRSARVALVASGTATLECLYFRLPMVIYHRIGPVLRLLARLFLHVRHIGLPNIVAGREIVPEFLTWRDVPERIAEAAIALFDDGEARERCLRDLDEAKARLGGPGASRRAAAAALALAREARSS